MDENVKTKSFNKAEGESCTAKLVDLNPRERGIVARSMHVTPTLRKEDTHYSEQINFQRYIEQSTYLLNSWIIDACTHDPY